MTRFGFAPQAPGETSQLLGSGKATLESILECADFSVELRNKNPQLLEFILKPSTLSRLIDILTESSTRSTHKRFLQLFQGSVTDIFSPVARNLPFVREAAVQLGRFHIDSVSFGLGTLSHMFSRAIDRWPEAVSDLFRLSESEPPGLFSILVEHLDKGVVYQVLADLMNESHPEVGLLAWYIFRALAGPEYRIDREKVPRKVFLAPELTFTFEQSEKYRLRATDLLHLFVQQPFPQYADFKELISEWLSTLDLKEFLPITFELAKQVPPSAVLKNKVLDALRSASDLSGDLVSLVIGYLPVSTAILEWWEAAGVFAKFLLAPELVQPAALACLEIVRAFVEKKNELFERAVKQVVSTAWNKFVAASDGQPDFLRASICIGSIDAVLPQNEDERIDNGLIPFQLLRDWGTVKDRPTEVDKPGDFWTQPAKKIANAEFLERLSQIVELSEVPEDLLDEPVIPLAEGGEVTATTTESSETVEPVVPPTESPVGPESASTPTESPATVEPVIPPTESPVSPEPVIPPTDSSGSSEPVSPPTDSSGSSEPASPPADSPGSSEPVSPPADSSGSSEPVSPPADSSGSSEPVSPPADSPGSSESASTAADTGNSGANEEDTLDSGGDTA